MYCVACSRFSKQIRFQFVCCRMLLLGEYNFVLFFSSLFCSVNMSRNDAFKWWTFYWMAHNDVDSDDDDVHSIQISPHWICNEWKKNITKWKWYFPFIFFIFLVCLFVSTNDTTHFWPALCLTFGSVIKWPQKNVFANVFFFSAIWMTIEHGPDIVYLLSTVCPSMVLSIQCFTVFHTRTH